MCFLCVPLLLHTSVSRWTIGALSVVILFSSYATVAATLDWNMIYNGDACPACKRLLRSIFAPVPPSSNFEGRIVCFSDLQPVSKTASFAPMRRDRNVYGKEFDTSGRAYSKGLVELDVRGLSTLALEAIPLEHGINCDHANWILAQFQLADEQ